MFKSLNEEDGGFVNEGLVIGDEHGRVHSVGPQSFNSDSSMQPTTIHISRSKYDQRKLYDEMKYKKPASKSSK